MKSTYVTDYRCPSCKAVPPDKSYTHGEEKWPKYSEECKGATPDGLYHDWMEHHKCINCDTLFNFRNGAY